ncbi:MAG TPA: MASE1 domain-containing protein [Gemmatimonadaceae bacterium]|nr:MASE1 domain-containing protein [Gemmatimonadaceae bacterium]
MTFPNTRNSLRYAAGFALVAAMYVVAGRLGFTASAVHPVVSSAWPPAGLALAALLLMGFRFAPAITVGAFVVNLTGGIAPLPSAAIALGNTLEAVVATWLLVSVIDFRPSLERLRDVFALAVVGAACTTISATVGTVALILSGSAASIPAATVWIAWFSGDTIGIVIVTTLILAWTAARRPAFTGRKIVEATVLGAILIGFTIALFQTPFSYVYAVFPVTIWAALRFGPRGAASASFILASLAVWYTVHGTGPFAGSTAVDNLFELQTFVAVVTLTSLILAAIIEERHSAESALQRSRQQHHDIVHYASVGVIQTDPDGNILLANPALAAIVGYDRPEELVGRNTLDALYWDRSDRSDFVRRIVLPEGAGREMQWKRKDGTLVWVDVHARVVKDVDGRPAYYEGFVYDLTGRKSLEGQFRQAQKMEAVGRLAGGVAHDFNNLLTVIGSCTDFILSDPTLAEDHRNDLEEVKRATDRATSLTRQLLAFGRTQVLRPSTLDLNERLAALHPMLKRLFETTIDIRIEPAANLWPVRADPTQIEQVLLNLALNARDAMPEGGVLTFTTENIGFTRDLTSTDQEYVMKSGDYVRLRVRDTGVGMDLETQRKIFEPFFTTKEIGRGTGLGLATAYGIVKQSGGYIKVRSLPGKGSEFWIYLPRTDAVVAERPVATERKNVRPVKGNVLIVEDEAAVRHALQRLLSAEGYSVLTASNGAEGLDLFSARKDEIELLITDIVMPAMTGQALADKCCSLRPALKVIYVSGYTRDSLLSQQTFADGTQLIEKPFTRETVLARISEVMSA